MRMNGTHCLAGSMEPFIFFIKGIVVGFAVAAPVGPVAVLCIRRTLANGLISGFATGIGAAVADMFYGAVAALGIGFVADLLAEHQIGFRILGGVVLVFMAARMLRASPREQKGDPDVRGYTMATPCSSRHLILQLVVCDHPSSGRKICTPTPPP